MICTSIPHVSSDVSDLKNHCHFENYYHTDLGYNYRMTNIQAALGFAQMKRLKEILRKKERIRKLYDSYLDSRFERNRFEDSPMDKSICWLYTVLVSDRNRFRERMSRFGIETRPVFIPMNEIPHLESRGSFPNSRFISEHGVSLPSHTNLSDKQIKFISEIANDSGFLSAL
jgi:perosamine synthetase